MTPEDQTGQGQGWTADGRPGSCPAEFGTTFGRLPP
jgi:hypothetical protein